MLKADKAISETNDVICNNIKQINRFERGFMSQNILAQLRNFVENVAIKLFSEYEAKDFDPNIYDNRKKSLRYVRNCGDLYFIRDFHKLLQESVSHYTVDPDSSERLMLKYYEYLLRIKQYLKQRFNIDVLENIEQFPLSMDTELTDYYKKIAEKIQLASKHRKRVVYSDRYYIQKIKPFFVEQQIYYEVTFTAANTKASKFDRIIAFTKHDIFDNYAVKLTIYTDTIHILKKEMPILIIDNYEISIRPCEFNNFVKILGSQTQYGTGSNEYKNLMTIIFENKISLTDIVCSEQEYYDNVKSFLSRDEKNVKICNMLDMCRKIIIGNMPGENILRYLLHRMNNRIIKMQYTSRPCEKLSSLYLRYACIPFDEMPYCTSLYQHNPKIKDLIASIPSSTHEHEIFIRHIKNNTEIEGNIFTQKDQIQGFENIDTLMQNYNSSLYHKHTNRRIEESHGFLYIKGYVDDCIGIINKLQEFASSGISQYTASVDSWLHTEAYAIDDKNKKEALRNMFEKSRVALIYGAAGTGKSTLIKHIANFFADKKKIFLANTHPAVDNMRRKVTTANSDFFTVAKFINGNEQQCDILFIDECSTINNSDIHKILQKVNVQLLVLVGDTYQIESIYFGNWFAIVQNFVPKTSIFELTQPFRAQNKELLTVWERVRECDTNILESLVANNYTSRLDDSIFEKKNDDEIILCLNYDGLYGINNINNYIQNNNPNNGVIWGTHTYKIGDPILFNESNRFAPLIHNNSKGRIVGIQPEEHTIIFDIELEESINELDACNYDFSLLDVSQTGKSVIRFSVNQYCGSDEEDDESTVVPFQVAYAVSIHKAQGLEYDSVKIIITNEIEEQISHNIFYTAITRAKRKLKIYWSPETENFVLKNFKTRRFDIDASRLKTFFLQSINK